MKVYYEPTLAQFNAWSGAITTVETIINADKEEEFAQLIEELHPDGLSETELNDILWFEDEWIFEQLGINEEKGE